LSEQELANLRPIDIDIYFKAMERIEAQEVLKQMKVTIYPKMKDEDRRQRYMQYYKIAYPTTNEGKKVLSTKEAFEALKGL